MFNFKLNTKLVYFLSVLVVFVSGVGIFVPGFYMNRLNDITIYEILGQDIISFIIGLSLFFCIMLSKKIKQFSILSTGFIVYICYTYAYFTFGLLNSSFYILYIFILSISFYLLISILLQILGTGNQIDSNKNRVSISVYLLVIVLIVGVIDTKDIVERTIITNSGINSKGVFYILDLAFLFPAMVLSAISSLKDKQIGNFFIGVFLLKTITLMPALILSDFIHYINNSYFIDYFFDIIACMIMIIACVMYYLFSIGIRKKSI